MKRYLYEWELVENQNVHARSSRKGSVVAETEEAANMMIEYSTMRNLDFYNSLATYAYRRHVENIKLIGTEDVE